MSNSKRLQELVRQSTFAIAERWKHELQKLIAELLTPDGIIEKHKSFDAAQLAGECAGPMIEELITKFVSSGDA